MITICIDIVKIIKYQSLSIAINRIPRLNSEINLRQLVIAVVSFLLSCSVGFESPIRTLPVSISTSTTMSQNPT